MMFSAYAPAPLIAPETSRLSETAIDAAAVVESIVAFSFASSVIPPSVAVTP